MTIFLLALVAISGLVDMGASREYEARLQTRGTRLALSKLADFESGIESLSSAATEGSFENSDDANWTWKAEVTPQGPPYLYLVSVTVTRDVKGVPFTLTLSQMIFDPVYLGTAGEATRPDASGTGGGPMILQAPSRRSGFTLLELLLASMIAAILLGALYLALNSTLEQTQASRDAADVEDLSRGAFNRIAIDLSSVLGPLPPKIAGTAGASSAAMDMTGMTGMTGDDGTDPAAMTDPSATAAANIPFHAGIIGVTDGERKYLVIFASRVPNVLSTPGALVQGPDITSGSQQVPSDLRRIIYWKGSNGGLCREERLWVTADGVGNSTTPDLSNEGSNTIVDDVVDFNVQYADGSGGWLDAWDGTTSSASGSGMSGPPRAIKVTLVLEFPNARPGGDPIQKTYVQVIPLRTAPGATIPTLVDPVVPADTAAQPSMGGK